MRRTLSSLRVLFLATAIAWGPAVPAPSCSATKTACCCSTSDSQLSCCAGAANASCSVDSERSETADALAPAKLDVLPTVAAASVFVWASPRTAIRIAAAEPPVDSLSSSRPQPPPRSPPAA